MRRRCGSVGSDTKPLRPHHWMMRPNTILSNYARVNARRGIKDTQNRSISEHIS